MKSLRGKKVIAGEIDGLIFTKSIQFSKHLFRKSNALGIDVNLLDALIKEGVVRIVLKDSESGKRYETPVERFLQKGWNYPKEGDQYYGKFQPQHFLGLERWTVIDSMGNVVQTGKEMEQEAIERDKRNAEYERKEKLRDKVKQERLF